MEVKEENREVESLHDTAKVSICGSGGSPNLAVNLSESTMLFLGNPERVGVSGSATEGITLRASHDGVLLTRSGPPDVRRRLTVSAGDIGCSHIRVTPRTVDVVLYPKQARVVVQPLPSLFLNEPSPVKRTGDELIDVADLSEPELKRRNQVLRRKLTQTVAEIDRLRNIAGEVSFYSSFEGEGQGTIVIDDLALAADRYSEGPYLDPSEEVFAALSSVLKVRDVNGVDVLKALWNGVQDHFNEYKDDSVRHAEQIRSLESQIAEQGPMVAAVRQFERAREELSDARQKMLRLGLNTMKLEEHDAERDVMNFGVSEMLGET